MKKRYHLKVREPRYLDIRDYSKLLDVVLEELEKKSPGLLRRVINWLFGKK
jgi:hypothetical protein